MDILFIDFETYYAKDYTLRKMTPAEYILDPRFEVICVAVKVNDGPTQVLDAPDFPAWLAQFDQNKVATVTYNALFDNCILAWHYGFVPYLMIDGLGMARALLGHEMPRLSLEAVSEHLGVGTKGNTIHQVSGMRRNNIKAAGLWNDFCAYCGNDNDLLYRIFVKLRPDFPKSEYRVMDLVLRCAVEPKFVVDTDMLQQHLDEVRADKLSLIESCGADKASLMSTASFCALLEALNVDIEYKISPTGRSIPALAKTDDFMNSLLEHDDPAVQALASARLSEKSTLEETRSQRFLNIANLNWANYLDGNPRLYSGGTLPIPLRYAGAHTHRLSGDWRMNAQNTPSSRTKGSKLRKSMKAPPGHKVVVADLGQIEARLTAWLCKADALLQQFKDKRDPYKELAAYIFSVAVANVQDFERFIGKSGVLGLGFGAGPPKFYNMVLRSARAAGMDMDALKLKWTEKLAEKATYAYRNLHFQIKNYWDLLEQHLRGAWDGQPGKPYAICGPVRIGDHTVTGPNGLKMQYEPAHKDPNSGNMRYSYGGRSHIIYGSKFLENIIQFLARIIIMNAALRLWGRGYRFVLQAHDELAFIVPDNDVDNAKQIIHEELTRSPSWAEDLPLTATVGSGQSYGDAK